MSGDKEFGASVGVDGSGKPKGSRLVKLPKPTGDGSQVRVFFPDLLKGMGFHYTAHPSGEHHLRTTSPPATAPIDTKAFAQDLLKDGPEAMLRALFLSFLHPPTPGHPAHLTVIHRAKEKFSQLDAKKTDLDVGALVADLEFLELNDTGFLPDAMASLRSEGTIREGDLVQIRVPATDEMSFFVPQDPANLKAHPLESFRSLAPTGGFFLTLSPPKTGPDGSPTMPVGVERFQPGLDELVKGFDDPQVQARFMEGATAMVEAMRPALEQIQKKLMNAKRLDEDAEEKGGGRE